MQKKDKISFQSIENFTKSDKNIRKINNGQKTKNSAQYKNNPLFLLTKNIKNPLWISVSEAAKLGGVQTKTIRRAIKSNNIRYKIVGNRYSVNFSSLISFLYKKTKLKNKLNQFGIGQYIREWRREWRK